MGGGVSAGGELKRNHVSSASGLKKATILPPADDILPSSNPLQMTRWWPSSSRLQMTHDSSSTHLLQRLPPPPSCPPAEDSTCRRQALIPCGGRLWNPCNL